MKLDCLDVYIVANAVHTVFMMETEIGYGLRFFVIRYDYEENAWETVSGLLKW